MSNLIEFGAFRLDVARHLLFREGEPVAVPAKALDILIVLVEARQQLVTKEALMNAVWPDAFVEEGNLSQNIHVLRKVLGEAADDHRYIMTVPGRGYRFVATLREVTDGPNAGTEVRPEPSPVEPSEPTGAFRDAWRGFWNRAKGRKRPLVIAAAAVMALLLGGAKAMPVVARSYNNRGVQLQRDGQLKAAMDYYRRAISLNPGYSQAHYNLAFAYEEIPDYDKALEEYQRAIDDDPKFYPAYNNLSRLYVLRRKDYGAALGLLDNALNQHPAESEVNYSLHKNYGWALFELRHLSQAEKHLRSAIALLPDRGSAHCLLAKVLDAQEKTKEAEIEWESCVAYSGQPDVEPDWRNEAQERLKGELSK